MNTQRGTQANEITGIKGAWLAAPVFDTVEDLRWKGPHLNFEEHCPRIT